MGEVEDGEDVVTHLIDAVAHLVMWLKIGRCGQSLRGCGDSFGDVVDHWGDVVDHREICGVL